MTAQKCCCGNVKRHVGKTVQCLHALFSNHEEYLYDRGNFLPQRKCPLHLGKKADLVLITRKHILRWIAGVQATQVEILPFENFTQATFFLPAPASDGLDGLWKFARRSTFW